MEDGGHGEHGQAGGDFLQDVGAIALADLGLAGGDFLDDEGVGSAGDDGDVEAFGGEETARGGLIDATVFGFGDPVELDGEFKWGGCLAGGISGARCVGKCDEGAKYEGYTHDGSEDES